MSDLFGKATKFMKSKQGKDLTEKVKKYASSEEGKEKLEEVKDMVTGHKDKEKAAKPAAAAEPIEKAGPDDATKPLEVPETPAS